jgi:hypothetical protein
MNLYQTRIDIDRVWDEIDALTDGNGGSQVDVPAELAQRIEKLALDFTAQLEWAYATIKNNEAWADACSEEAAAFYKKGKAYQARADATRRLVEYVLDGDAWKAPDGKRGFSFAKCPPSAYIPDPAKVPDEYCVFERTPLKQDILRDLKAGRAVEGAELITDKRTLRIK